jgi:hypothetical protein
MRGKNEQRRKAVGGNACGYKALADGDGKKSVEALIMREKLGQPTQTYCVGSSRAVETKRCSLTGK